jgi:hypothetical protein
MAMGRREMDRQKDLFVTVDRLRATSSKACGVKIECPHSNTIS